MQVYFSDPNEAISTEMAARFKENFRLLDTNKDGKLSRQEVGILYRAFGQNPTDEDLAKLLKPIPSGGLDFDQFVDFYSKNYRQPTPKEVLIKAFQVFDADDTGVMNASKLKEMLTSLGEPMPAEEVDAILKEAQ